MNIKSRKIVNSRSFTALPLFFLLFTLTLAVLRTAEAATVGTKKAPQEKSILKHKKKNTNNKKYRKKRTKKRIITCDSYSRNKLLNKANKYQKLITQAAQDYKVSPSLITAVITVESCFRPKARSSSGAAGLMQLMPATARRFGTTNRYNNKHNIKAGTKYLKFLLNRFDGNVQLAAAGYNAGEGAVDKYNGVPPYRETRAYVKKVLNAYRKLSHLSPRQHLAQKASTQRKTREWYRKQYEQKNMKKKLTRGLNLTNSEIRHVDELLQPNGRKSSLSFKQVL